MLRTPVRALLALLLLAPAGWAGQDRSAEIFRRIEETLRAETERTRRETLEWVRRELAVPPAPASAPAPARSGSPATVELLKKHASYLASDELEGRCAGYPGAEKASEYIAEVFKAAGLKPGGDAGGWFQKFRLSGKDARNVVGVLEAADPERRGEFVVVGAHYDHVGTAEQRDYGRLGAGKSDDTIWNGADDNASGTTCLLALARVFGEGRLEPRRSIVFIAFSGEEAGLVGSRWYVNHPLAPMEKHWFMLNLDMVGRNPQRPIEVHGVGSSAGGEIRRAVEKAAERSGLKAKINDEVKLVGGDSDHSSFADKKVPYAFFFSGFHADYHRPSDHPEKLAYDSMLKLVHASTDILLEMAALEERPKFAGKARPTLNLPDLLNPGLPPRRLGVTVRELDEDECDALKLGPAQGALAVDAVQAGSAAEKAGLQAGDVLLSVAGTILPRGNTRDELRRILTDKVKPGKEVEVLFRRGERAMSAKAVWSE